jgi:N-hydroxyarylamine O-acetyltransferase
MPSADTPISPALRDRVLARLGLDAPPAPDLGGLRTVYGAWCAHVPFDNVRKMTALRGSSGAPLPGSDATDFLEAWLAHGTGGTCWPSSTGLFALLESLDFPARRVVGSMRDMGVPNHASIKVALDGRDWLVDSSILCHRPLPLGDAVTVVGDAPHTVEVEPIDGTHVIWFASPPHEFFPCRLVLDPVDGAFYRDAYERSRTASPFNARLYARRNHADAQVVLRGATLVRRTAEGMEERLLSGDELCEALCREIGISPELVEAWAASGALADTLAPGTGAMAFPPFPSVPPSRRAAVV